MTDPYAAPQADLSTPIETVEYAGFWARFAASVVDGILMMCITIPILGAVYGMSYLESGGAGFEPLGLVINYVLPAVVVLLFWRAKGATPGKMLLGIKIVDAKTFAHPTMGRFVARYVGYFVSMIVFFLGYIWAAFDKRKQAWHDKIGGTVVIKK